MSLRLQNEKQRLTGKVNIGLIIYQTTTLKNTVSVSEEGNH